MNFFIIIPAYNEAQYLAKTLDSLVNQSFLPKKILVVNDGSTDTTQDIIAPYAEKYEIIEGIFSHSETLHAPGSKVVNAFNSGLSAINEKVDVLCKFDADLIFPKNYLERISEIFKNNDRIGMAGGLCYIYKKEAWVLEALTRKTHLRGALKAYRKECFDEIGGLKSTMGWDTIDELLAQYHGWEVRIDESLHVKHLKPTGTSYTAASRYKQGEAFYKMRYGWWLTVIASAKLAFRKKSSRYFFDCLKGYLRASKENIAFAVSEEEGSYIRKLRWKGIKERMF